MTTGLLTALGLVAGIALGIIASVATVHWALWHWDPLVRAERMAEQAARNADLRSWLAQLPTYTEAASDHDQETTTS